MLVGGNCKVVFTSRGASQQDLQLAEVELGASRLGALAALNDLNELRSVATDKVLALIMKKTQSVLKPPWSVHG